MDDPRDAVHTADALVADVTQKLAVTFADHKQAHQPDHPARPAVTTTTGRAVWSAAQGRRGRATVASRFRGEDPAGKPGTEKD